MLFDLLKMETQKIVNLLNDSDNESSKFAADTNVAFKNCSPFTSCVTHVNDEHVETAENWI